VTGERVQEDDLQCEP